MNPNRYVSPDGLLTLVVEALPEENDWIIYFDGYPWHTHPDVLAGTTSIEARSVIDQFVKELINDRLTIELTFRGDALTEIEPGLPVDQDHSEELNFAREWLMPSEKHVFRLWSGQVLYTVP